MLSEAVVKAVEEAAKIFAAVKAEGIRNPDKDARVIAANWAIREVYPACRVDAHRAAIILGLVKK